MSMPNPRSAAATLQNIVAGSENIHTGSRNIPRRPGRLKATDSPLARRRLADKLTVGPALEAALRLDDADQTQLAVACGRDQGAVSRWHSATSPDVPTLLDVRWARLAGLHHWAKAANEIAMAGIVLIDDQARAALQQAREAIDALLGRDGG